jgi:CubicO group peptidase (beta-lactamase class C family)
VNSLTKFARASWTSVVAIMRMMMVMLFLTLPALAAAAGRSHVEGQLDEYIHREMREDHLVGLSLAVLQNGRMVVAKGYGLANVETGTLATPMTVYKIGSVSKQFISTAVVLLAAEGRLSFGDRLDKYLEDAPETWKGITVEELLTHTSGLRAQQAEGDPPGYEPYSGQPNIEVIRHAYAVPLDFPPGQRWAYSNLGYFVLAEIISRASGVPWDEYIRRKVFAPAGLTATRVTSTVDIVSNRASGYEFSNGNLQNAPSWTAVRPSGAFLSTVVDLAKWDTVLYANSLLSSAMQDRMWRPVTLKDGSTYPYGFGWAVDEWRGHRRIHHNGGIPGFRSDFERFVDDKLTVIVTTNTTPVDPEKIALEIVALYAHGWSN